MVTVLDFETIAAAVVFGYKGIFPVRDFVRHKAIQTAVVAQWGAKMDGLAAEKALPFENKYQRSCSAMCNPRRSTPFCIDNLVHEFINTELHVKVGTRPVELSSRSPAREGKNHR